MKSVLIQSIIRRRKKEVLDSEPEGRDIERAADVIVGIIFVLLILVIVGSVAYAN